MKARMLTIAALTLVASCANGSPEAIRYDADLQLSQRPETRLSLA